MEIDQERLNTFQERMSSWVAGQGLFFQLRYAAAVQGAQSSLFAVLMRLVMRLLILVLLLAIGLWVFLAKRVDFGWFRDDLGEKISMALEADSVVVGAVKRERGHVSLQRISLEGGEESFFYNAEIRDLRTRMGLLDGVVKEWNGETVSMKTLTLTLKAGADADAVAEAAYASMFKVPGEFKFDVIDIESANISWGYSELHKGSIQGAHLKASRRSEGGWTLVFKGGLFSQNWLKRFAIERMEVIVSEDQLEIVEMALIKDGGSLELTGKMVEGGGRPVFEGSGRMSSLPVWSVLEPDYRAFVDGVISGEVSFSGSTNTQRGFEIEAAVSLEDGDHVVLRDRFPLFRAISAVDRLRSYKKVRFSSGRFRMKTGGNSLQLSNIWLNALELMRMEGDVLVRLPTDEEVDERLKVLEEAAREEGRSLDRAPTTGGRSEESEDKEMSLEDAAKAEKEAKDKKEKSLESLIYGSQTGSEDIKSIHESAWERESKYYFLEGQVRLGITEDVFDRAPALDKAYPVEAESGLRWLDLTMKGSIFEVGNDLADRIYLQSRGVR